LAAKTECFQRRLSKGRDGQGLHQFIRISLKVRTTVIMTSRVPRHKSAPDFALRRSGAVLSARKSRIRVGNFGTLALLLPCHHWISGCWESKLPENSGRRGPLPGHVSFLKGKQRCRERVSGLPLQRLLWSRPCFHFTWMQNPRKRSS